MLSAPDSKAGGGRAAPSRRTTHTSSCCSSSSTNTSSSFSSSQTTSSRRRPLGGGCSATLLLGLLLAAAAASLPGRAAASLVAIDLGAEYLKVCLVKPGRTPISIVVNEMSKRKSPALVGLLDGTDRVLGEEAFSMAIRYPTSVYPGLRNLLGRSAKDAEVARLLKQSMALYEVVDHPATGTAAVKVNETAAYLVEELVAGILQYARGITDAQAGEPVVDAVITVPVWLGAEQRTALLDAARLAGLNVLGLINTHAAAALQYGIERDFTKKEQTVVLYDMGSGSTQVALVKYSSYGKTKSTQTNQLEVLDVEWDHGLGANALDALLVQHFAEEFKAKGGDDISASPKALAKLRRQVRRTKEVLSANTAAPLNVEELSGGRDFAATINRADFEALAGDFWDRAAAPLTKLLARNKLKPGDIDAVELLGGGSRVPKLQAVLSEALGGRHLDRHLDADEAVVLGAGLFAANMSSSFRLRKFGMTDHATFGVAFESDDLFVPSASTDGGKKGAKKGGDDDGSASSKPGHVLKALLPAGKKLPIKRAIKYANLTIDGFSFTLDYNASARHGLPPGVTAPRLAAYTVAGISDAIKRYNYSGTTALRFEADHSGLLHFTAAECVVEQEVTEDKVIEVPAPPEAGSNATTNGTAAATGTAAEGADKEADGEKKEEGKDAKGADAAGAANATDAAGNTTANATAEAPKMIKKTIQVTRRKTYNVALNISGPGPAHPPLSGAPLAAAQANISGWVVAEAAKAATAKAKNDLEAYIIATREGLETSETLQQVTTEEARVAFTEQLGAAEDWLYGDGEDSGAAAFAARLAELKAVGDPMAHRASELELRAQVLPLLAEQVAAAEQLIASWAEEKPWIGENDTKKATDKVTEFKAWLAEQEAAQAKKGPTDAPAFLTADLVAKWEGVQKAAAKIDKKTKPKPPPAAAADGKNGTTAAGNATSDTDGAGAGDGGAGKGEAKAGAGAGGQQQEAGAAAGAGDDDEELPAHEEL